MMGRIRLTERDLRLLGIFRALVEEEGLTAAEARLGMERSTISRHLQALEGRIGGTLCLRGPRGFDLTDLGHQVFRAALAAHDAILRAEEQLAQSVDSLTGKIFLGTADNTISNAACNIVEAVHRFRAMAPEVETHLSVGPPPEIIEDIMMRRLDFAFLAVPSPHLGLAADLLFDEEFRLYGYKPLMGPLSLAKLGSLGFAVVTRDQHWQSEALAEELRLPHLGVGRGLEAVATLIASGGYVGFLPTHMIGSLSPRYRLAEVEGADHLRYIKTFALVYEPARSFSRAGMAFSKIVREVHGKFHRRT